MKLFKPEDFQLWDKSASEEAAEQANAKLEAWLAEQPEVFGCEGDAITKHMRWAGSRWVNIHTQEPRSSHRARLVAIEKIEGEK